MNLLGKILLFFFAFAVGLISLRYMNFEVQDILQDRAAALETLSYQLGFYSHVLLSPIALLLGPFQFVPAFRKKYLKAHRMMGKVYVLACLLGGISGLVIAFFTYGGWITTLGFALLGILWFYTTLMAFLSIRKREVQTHRVWMHRSYALAWAAVTLRLWNPILQGGLGMDFITAYQTVAWLSWVPNLVLIEFLLRRKYAAKFKQAFSWM